jgi:hypothetical protein
LFPAGPNPAVVPPVGALPAVLVGVTLIEKSSGQSALPAPAVVPDVQNVALNIVAPTGIEGAKLVAGITVFVVVLLLNTVGLVNVVVVGTFITLEVVLERQTLPNAESAGNGSPWQVLTVKLLAAGVANELRGDPPIVKLTCVLGLGH